MIRLKILIYFKDIFKYSFIDFLNSYLYIKYVSNNKYVNNLEKAVAINIPAIPKNLNNVIDKIILSIVLIYGIDFALSNKFKVLLYI